MLESVVRMLGLSAVNGATQVIPVWGQLQLKSLFSYCQVIDVVEPPETVICQNSKMGLTACVQAAFSDGIRDNMSVHHHCNNTATGVYLPDSM